MLVDDGRRVRRTIGEIDRLHGLASRRRDVCNVTEGTPRVDRVGTGLRVAGSGIRRHDPIPIRVHVHPRPDEARSGDRETGRGTHGQRATGDLLQTKITVPRGGLGVGDGAETGVARGVHHFQVEHQHVHPDAVTQRHGRGGVPLARRCAQVVVGHGIRARRPRVRPHQNRLTGGSHVDRRKKRAHSRGAYDFLGPPSCGRAEGDRSQRTRLVEHGQPVTRGRLVVHEAGRTRVGRHLGRRKRVGGMVDPNPTESGGRGLGVPHRRHVAVGMDHEIGDTELGQNR